MARPVNEGAWLPAVFARNASRGAMRANPLLPQSAGDGLARTVGDDALLGPDLYTNQLNNYRAVKTTMSVSERIR
ncbi:MAG: hypothetical protein IT181_13095 [Acidobacteria bacterium]|nr:hypothetical protein [Acidobacteriota bacterium]